ncbi:hypothetical protein O4H52_16790 [Sphingomonadaceae bacterium G21617-S1]|nr:hypothetical protein [Sphingomonadaceae bacterium G21617-S1]
MSGDRLVAIVAIVAMLILVVPSLARRGLPAGRIFRLAVMWAVIFLGVTAAVLMLGR